MTNSKETGSTTEIDQIQAEIDAFFQDLSEKSGEEARNSFFDKVRELLDAIKKLGKKEDDEKEKEKKEKKPIGKLLLLLKKSFEQRFRFLPPYAKALIESLESHQVEIARDPEIARGVFDVFGDILRDQKDLARDAEEIVATLKKQMEENPQLKPVLGKIVKDFLMKLIDEQEDVIDPRLAIAQQEAKRKLIGEYRGVLDEQDEIEIITRMHEKTLSSEVEQFIQSQRMTNLALANPSYQEEFRAAAKDFSIRRLKEEGILIKRDDGTYDLDRHKLKRLVTFRFYKVISHVHKERNVEFNQTSGAREVQAYVVALESWLSQHLKRIGEVYFKSDSATQSWLNSISSTYPRTLMKMAAVFHNVPIWANTSAGAENLAKLSQSMFASELSVFLDKDSEVMHIARKVIPEYLRRRLVKNKNILPADLYAGEYKQDLVYYTQPDLDNIREDLVDIVKKALGKEAKDWEIEMAITYGMAIGTLTLIDEEVIASADPRPDPLGIRGLASIIRPWHNWALGRLDYHSAPFKELFFMPVVTHPKDRKLLSKLLFNRRWVPKRIQEYVNKRYEMYSDLMADRVWGLYSSYTEILNLLATPASIVTRAGWRVQEHKGFVMDVIKANKEEYNIFYDGDRLKDTDEWGEKEWEVFFAISTKELGMASVWWWFSDLADKNLDKILKKTAGKKVEYAKKNPYVNMFRIKVGGKLTDVNYLLMKEYNRWLYKGKVLSEYMRRNPGDFFLILSQLVPDLAYDSDVFKSDSEIEEKYSHNTKKAEQVKGVKKDLITRWGEANYQVLKGLHKWFAEKIVPFYTGEQQDWGKALDEFSRDMSAVFLRAEKRVKNMPLVQSMEDVYLKEEDFDCIQDQSRRERLKEFILGEGGFVRLFPLEGLPTAKDFGDPESFFGKLGYIWEKRQGEMNPLSIDVDSGKLVSRFARHGEDVLSRLMGDQFATYKNMIEKMQKFGSLVAGAARTGDLSKIIEFQNEIKSFLKSMHGSEIAYRANVMLSNIVISFFWEHSDARWPLGLLNKLIKPFFGRNLSLSKLVIKDKDAYSMDQEEVNKYILQLEKLGILPPEGMWSTQHLRLAFDTTSEQYYFNVGITGLQIVLLVILLYALKKALEEIKEEGK